MTNTALEPTGKALPEPVARRGINEAQWRTLKGSLYPGASSESVLAVWDYCVARRLDPLKRPVPTAPRGPLQRPGPYRPGRSEGRRQVRVARHRDARHLRIARDRAAHRPVSGPQ